MGFSKRSERDPGRWDGDPEPAGGIDGVLPAALADRLPPIYRRSGPVVVRSLGIVAFLAGGAAYLSDAVVADPFSLAKAAVDRSRRLASDAADPSGVAGWFTPENPRPEWRRSR